MKKTKKLSAHVFFSNTSVPSFCQVRRKIYFQLCKVVSPAAYLLIAALILSAGYYSAPIFYNSKNFLQFKEFELYWGAVFFLRSVHTFS